MAAQVARDFHRGETVLDAEFAHGILIGVQHKLVVPAYAGTQCLHVHPKTLGPGVRRGDE
ncbi:hypothetical protein GCM10009105_11790 [Dokdonella soli]|uniref:Uncharacterized protein n=1 Tax=Dokdonella soli TaxID=529810 RepID=A0ABN1IEE8_9GAMM